mmetsp:Transcript_492/g.931  ORF Transcript_492/g.931 Transcript_492/m.931 type:complete len:275 (-) Transcript_492:515-1339(-)
MYGLIGPLLASVILFVQVVGEALSTEYHLELLNGNGAVNGWKRWSPLSSPTSPLVLGPAGSKSIRFEVDEVLFLQSCFLDGVCEHYSIRLVRRTHLMTGMSDETEGGAKDRIVGEEDVDVIATVLVPICPLLTPTSKGLTQNLSVFVTSSGSTHGLFLPWGLGVQLSHSYCSPPHFLARPTEILVHIDVRAPEDVKTGPDLNAVLRSDPMNSAQLNFDANPSLTPKPDEARLNNKKPEEMTFWERNRKHVLVLGIVLVVNVGLRNVIDPARDRR